MGSVLAMRLTLPRVQTGFPACLGQMQQELHQKSASSSLAQCTSLRGAVILVGELVDPVSVVLRGEQMSLACSCNKTRCPDSFWTNALWITSLEIRELTRRPILLERMPYELHKQPRR